MKPTLVCLDFKGRTARRYVPKSCGGFFKETAVFGKEDIMGFGGESGLEIIENFRTGVMKGQETFDEQPEQA